MRLNATPHTDKPNKMTYCIFLITLMLKRSFLLASPRTISYHVDRGMHWEMDYKFEL